MALRAAPPQSLRDSSPLKGEQLLRMAKTLRNNSTGHERWMWTELRNLKHHGLRFRRQVVLGSFIVDFACHRSKTVIELDGSQHGEEKHAQKDKLRDEWLEREGYMVLRFWNGELHDDIGSVVDAIYEKATQRIPSPRGGRWAKPKAWAGRGDEKMIEQSENKS